MTFSTSTIALFEELLAQVQLNAGHPEFEEKAAAVVKAKREIAEAKAERE